MEKDKRVPCLNEGTKAAEKDTRDLQSPSIPSSSSSSYEFVNQNPFLPLFAT